MKPIIGEILALALSTIIMAEWKILLEAAAALEEMVCRELEDTTLTLIDRVVMEDLALLIQYQALPLA
jgi:hypothetical protein